MNAVKRCLALFAVTLVVGACGSDQTADDAGTNLHIRATPGAVWTRHNSTPATFVVDAIDNLGGNTEGSWEVESSTGPMTVVLDTAYQSTSNGPLGLAARFIVTPTAAGDGFVVVTGTGGTDTVPVRIAPDTGAFAVVFSDSSSALHQQIVATAPAGMVFTGGTTVRFFSGSQARDTSNGGLSFPSVIARNADSSQITFVTGPGAYGTARFTGLASRSTPTLVTTARANFAMTDTTPRVDTTAFSVAPAFVTTGTRATASVLDTLVLTAPANYVFLASSKAELWRFTLDANGNTVRTVSNGTSAPFTIGRSADSTKLYVAMAPGGRGRLQVNKIAFRVAPAIQFNVNGPAAETFDLRQGASGPDTSNFAITFSKASPIAEGDTVTATAPAGMVFLPGTVMINAGTSGTPSGGDSARIVLISADSTKVTFRLPPGASGKFRYSAMARRDYPAIVWGGRSATTISAVAAPAVVATMNPSTANMNDTVTVVLDSTGPYRFRPTSQALITQPSIILSISTDSLTMKLLAPPGQSGPVTLTNIRYANLPTFQVQAQTASSLTANAPTSLGPDDVVNSFTVVAPGTIGGIKGFWDQMTMTDADPSPDCDGGAKAQFYTVTVSTTGSYSVSTNWTSGSDIDIGVMVKDGGYDGGGSCSDYLNTTGLSSARPEVTTVTLTAGITYVIAVIDFTGASTTAGAVSVVIRRAS